MSQMASPFHASPSKDFITVGFPQGVVDRVCSHHPQPVFRSGSLCRFAQNPSMTEMLLKAQNAVGELYLEIGMTQKGLSYFQKAWSNLLRFTLSDLKSSQELLKQKGRRHLQRPLHSCSSESNPRGLLSPGRGKDQVFFF